MRWNAELKALVKPVSASSSSHLFQQLFIARG